MAHSLSNFLAAGVFMVAGVAQSAELPIKTSFKMGAGAQSGGLQDTSNRGYQLNVAFAGEYKLTEKGSIVGELGWRYLPGMERIASRYQEQNVTSGVVGTPAYYKYETGQILRNEMFNVRSQGWQLGILYSHELSYDFYAFGGLRAQHVNTREMVYGSEIEAGVAPEAVNVATPVVRVTNLGKAVEISNIVPGAAIGIGYSFLDAHAVELSMTTSSVETERFGKKSGVLIDFVYRMKF